MDKDKFIAVQLADMIMDLTDPKITRWQKEQIAILARAKAKKFLDKNGARLD